LQRGAKLEMVLTGTNLAGPTGIYTSFPAKATIPTDAKNGTDNTKLKIILEVAADAPVGPHQIRIATTRGLSNFRVLCIEDLPTLAEDNKNNAKESAQTLPVPAVVTGKTDAEKSDWFKINVAAGQRLSFDLLGHRIGSTLDPQLSVYHAKSGNEIAHDNDSPGAQSDPRLSYHFKEAGDYLVEVRDVLYRGGAEYFYSLRIGDFPLASSAIPMAAKRGSKVKVDFAGPYVQGATPVEIAVPNDPSQAAIWVTPKGPGGLSGWPVFVALSDIDELTEQEPNNELAKAQRLPLPSGVTGRLNPSSDSDYYLLTAKKGEKIAIEVKTLEFQSPSLVYLVVKNAKTGAELAKSNPQAAPPADQRIDFTAPADGDYAIEVQHLNLLGGTSEAYHLVIAPAGPSFEAAMSLERFDAAPGLFAPLPISITRKGYNGPIELEVVGDAGLGGKATVKAGQGSAVLLVTTAGDLPLGPKAFRIVARATIDKKLVAQPVSVETAVSQSMANLSFPPLPWTSHLVLAVREKAPFKLTIRMDPAEGVPGIPATVTVLAERDPGFDEAIELSPPAGLPPGVPAVKLGPIAKGKNEITFKLDLNPKVPVGDYQVLIAAKAKSKGKDYAASTPPLNVAVGMPFELKIEPMEIVLKPGGKAKLKVSTTRRGGYAGPITLELRKLPANVTATKATLNKDQGSVELEISAAPAAAAAEVKNADVLGTATGLANLQNASPDFTLRVEKK